MSRLSHPRSRRNGLALTLTHPLTTLPVSTTAARPAVAFHPYHRPGRHRHRRRQMAPTAACRGLSFIALTLSPLAASHPRLPGPNHCNPRLPNTSRTQGDDGSPPIHNRLLHSPMLHRIAIPLTPHQARSWRHRPHALVTMHRHTRTAPGRATPRGPADRVVVVMGEWAAACATIEGKRGREERA